MTRPGSAGADVRTHDQFVRWQNQMREILAEMSRTLTAQVLDIEKQARGARAETFVHYKHLRERYLASRDLMETMTDRYQDIKKVMPVGFYQLLVKYKLRALAAYADISFNFFSNPPETVVRSLGAYEVLSNERDSFSRVLGYFDNMLMEAAVDDRTADALEATRDRIEQTINFLNQLLLETPKQLEEFD